MGIAYLTAMMIQGNNGEFVTTAERHEYWITKEGRPHALMLSAPLDKRAELEDAVEKIKAESRLSEP